MAAQQVWMAGGAQDQGRETRALQNWEGVVLATYAQDQCRLKNNGRLRDKGQYLKYENVFKIKQ